MIKDNISRAKIYYGISNNLKKGFEWIKNNDLKKLSEGRYELSDGMYANVQSYLTKDYAPYEAHRKYIDIQYMISGSEKAGVVDYQECSTTEKYDDEKDVEFLSCRGEEQFYKLEEGEFFVFFPHDAHKPSIKIDKNSNVKKVIVKVPV